MRAIGGHHAVEGCGGDLCVRDSQHRNPTNGRQGKSPASGAAYVVGKIGDFADALVFETYKADWETFQTNAAQRPTSPPISPVWSA